ncbi:MAG: hypothetical protein QOG87_2450 [Actinomycetota bacterium]|jgi:hypothetical protein
MLGKRVKRTRKGEYQLRLPPEERDLLRGLPGQLKGLIDTDDPSLRRLFPPAYKDDPALEAEYRHYMADDLVASHQAALDVMEETIDAEQLGEEQLVGWLGALNDLRLVLGTRLDVTEDMYEREMDPDDPRAPAFAVYSYLGWLQEQVVDALSG